MSLPASALGFEITFPGPKLMPGLTLHGGAGGGPQETGAVPGVGTVTGTVVGVVVGTVGGGVLSPPSSPPPPLDGGAPATGAAAVANS
ncbi:MAG: hypothetical protein WBJ33_03045 [Candidatus Nanopelagicales bacterium]